MKPERGGRVRKKGGSTCLNPPMLGSESWTVPMDSILWVGTLIY